jgi:tetratricopeptide (TPR) repeat protein
VKIPAHALLLAASVGLLAGCETAQQRVDTAVPETAPTTARAADLPFPEPERPDRELDEDLIYSYLVGEIAAHRGQLEVARRHYEHAAILARDAYAAQRATRIALHLKDYDAGLASAQRWVELAPNDMTARQLAAVLLLRSGDLQRAGEQLDALVRIADARDHDGFLQAASALSVEGDQAGARELIIGLHARHPDDVRSLYAVAVLEMAHRELASAEPRLREVIDRAPDWEQPRVLLSRLLVAGDRRDEAVALLADSVDRAPDSSLLRTAYSRLLVDVGDYAGALAQFAALHVLDPEDDEITFGYAMLATQQESWDEARELWQQLREDRERRDEASYYLAQIEEQAGNDELAIELYQSVTGELEIDAGMRLSQIHARAGRLDEAREALREARIASPNRAADLYIAETQVLQRYGEPADALAAYETAIDAYPDNFDLRYNRALFLLELDDFPAMERELRAILDEDPEHVDSLNALGYTLAERNERLDEAYDLVARALAQRPDSAAILDSMGWVLYRQGRLAEATDYLRRALARAPTDDEIAAHLAEVLWVRQQQDAARDVLREASSHHPDSDKIRAVVEEFGVEL